MLTSVHLDNPASGFAARDAQVYLPPAYFAHPRPKLPVAYSETPGAHTWRAWAAGFAESLPWLSARLGLTGEDS